MVRVLLDIIEGGEIMAYTEAHHQGAIKMI